MNTIAQTILHNADPIEAVKLPPVVPIIPNVQKKKRGGLDIALIAKAQEVYSSPVQAKKVENPQAQAMQTGAWGGANE